jgi:hypothetical protein
VGSFGIHIPLALEGQWSGAAAVAIVLTGIVIFMGTIYYLLTTIFGWRRAYYVLMVSLMGFMIILSLVWLVGIPGTGPGFGPRGREPEWKVFAPESQQAADFKADLATYPSGWAEPGKKYFGNHDSKQTGAIDSKGEIDTIKGILQPALAGLFQKRGTGSAKPTDYSFRLPATAAEEAKLSPDELAVPVATVRFQDTGGGVLLFGVTIPAVPGAHPEVTAFAYRDKGTVFMPALEFLLAALVLFGVHLWLLARDEMKQKARDAATATTPTTVRTGV